MAKKLNAARIFLKEDFCYSFYEGKDVFIPIEMISKVIVYEHNIGKTLVYTTLTGFGVAMIALVIFAIMKGQSCPFIYTYDGNDYNFIGEIYSGAVYPQLERHDYLKLSNLVNHDGKYNIKITNEVKEIQHTNFVELIAVNHPENTEAYMDKYGKVFALSNIQAPLSAINNTDRDVLNDITDRDEKIYFGVDKFDNTNLTENLYLSFKKPKDKKTASLVINARNSIWLDYAYGEFYNLFGSAYNKWQEKQEKVSAEILNKWSRKQGIPISVYLKKNNEWEFVDYYNIIGPMAFKDDVLELDVSDIPGDKIEVKLEYGFLFWEIDYVGLGENSSELVKQEVIEINDAYASNGGDVKDLMISDDDKYYTQPNIGDVAEISFKAISDDEKTNRSFFLHSKGHYKILKNPSGIPNIAYLNEFKNKNKFTEFSREKFLETIKELDLQNQ